MPIKKSKVVPAGVRRVKNQFDRWRADKGARERIPRGLWVAAGKLCESYSVGRVSRWLGLNHTTLRDHVNSHSRPSPRRCLPNSKPAFVEWSPPMGNLSGSTAKYVMELSERGSAAQRIHVHGASVSEVAALARALRSGGSEG